MNQAIRTYIDAQFATVKASPEVERAHRELLQMSEDKYHQLISQGISDQQATGQVIIEFGNLDDLADELGIRDAVEQARNEKPVPLATAEQIQQAVVGQRRASFLIAAGVFLVLAGIALVAAFGLDRPQVVILPTAGIAVALFILAPGARKPFAEFERGRLEVSPRDAQHFQSKLDRADLTYRVGIAAGVLMILTGFFATGMTDGNQIWFLAGTAIGVAILIINGMHRTALQVLATSDAVSRTQRLARQEAEDRIGVLAMIVWPATTIVYLAWSFITDDWHFTWVIWPVIGLGFGVTAGLIDRAAHRKYGLNWD